MTMDPWKSWNLHFARCPPVGFLLREAAWDRWIRIYNLPRAKRLPRSKSEVALIRNRQSAVADFILGGMAEVVVWGTSFKGAAPAENWILAPRRHDWSPLMAEVWVREPQFYYRQMRWQSGSLSQEFAAVARGESDPLVVLSPNTGEVVCPYDGGVDLILADGSRVSEAKDRFADWLSDLPSGL